MIVISQYCILKGDNFSPKKTSDILNISFDEMNEKGELGIIGRYKGKAIPYGSCVIRTENEEYKILNILEKHIYDFKKYGVEEIMLHWDVAYQQQCNFEIGVDYINRLSKLSIPLSVSCFDSDEVLE